MKCNLLFFLAALVLASTAPVQDVSQEALLQEAFEDIVSNHVKSAASTRLHTTDNPRGQRFLPKEVQERYNTGNTEKADTNGQINDSWQTSEEGAMAEIEGFQQFLSSALKLVDSKLKPSSRTPEEDQDAVNNPTKWRDLGRNFLRVLQDKLDRGEGDNQPTNGGQAETERHQINYWQTSEEEAMAEIEGFRRFLSSTLKLVDNKLKPSSRTPEEDQDAVNNPTKWRDLGRNFLQVLQDKLDRGDRDSQPVNGGQVETEGKEKINNWQTSEEKAMAEIEGFRQFLRNTLKLVDSKLKPSSRTPEEDQDAVNNPTKWRDLGRNFLRVLQDKLDRGDGDNQPTGGGEETADGATFT